MDPFFFWSHDHSSERKRPTEWRRTCLPPGFGKALEGPHRRRNLGPRRHPVPPRRPQAGARAGSEAACPSVAKLQTRLRRSRRRIRGEPISRVWCGLGVWLMTSISLCPGRATPALFGGKCQGPSNSSQDFFPGGAPPCRLLIRLPRRPHRLSLETLLVTFAPSSVGSPLTARNSPPVSGMAKSGSKTLPAGGRPSDGRLLAGLRPGRMCETVLTVCSVRFHRRIRLLAPIPEDFGTTLENLSLRL